MGHPRPLFIFIFVFETNIIIFTTNRCEKCPSSIRCWDSNPRPLKHELSPITTRPGLRPYKLFYLASQSRNEVDLQWTSQVATTTTNKNDNDKSRKIRNVQTLLCDSLQNWRGQLRFKTCCFSCPVYLHDPKFTDAICELSCGHVICKKQV